MVLVLAPPFQAWTAPQGESIWLLIGTVGMLLGMLYFVAAGWGEDDPRKQEFYVITIFVPAIAAVSYLAMSLGYGVTTIQLNGAERTIYWARYADWLFTTPLLLMDLALLADADRNTIATLVGLDVAMVITGLMGALTNRGALGLGPEAVRLIWWGVSTAFFVVLLYFLFGVLSRQAGRRPGEVGQLFATLRNLTVVLWTAYPVVWLIGTEGLGFIGLSLETAAFMVLDLLAKVGFGLILVQSRSALDRATSTAGAPAGD